MTIATIAQLVLLMLLWAICFPLITAGIEFAPHLTFAALRAALAGITLTLLAFALNQSLPRERGVWMMIAGIGFGATSLGFFGMFHAAEFVSPGIATVIANTQPLLAAVLGALVLHEKLNAIGKTGLILGFVGILFIASRGLFNDEQGDFSLGMTYIVLAAIGISVSNVLIKRIAGEVDALMGMGLQMIIGAIPLLLIALVMEDPTAIVWSPTFVGSLIGLSLLGSALVYWLWFTVLERVALNRANAFSFLIPIFGLAMGAVFYGETLNWQQFVGIVLTILGVVLVNRKVERQKITGN